MKHQKNNRLNVVDNGTLHVGVQRFDVFYQNGFVVTLHSASKNKKKNALQLSMTAFYIEKSTNALDKI